MTASKSERLINLVIMLLVARTYVTKEQIRSTIEGYQTSSEEAFEKMFERDKEELRDLGIPLETGFVDAFFEDEQGYRIARDAYELPDIEIDAEEAAVLGLAATVWQHAGLAADTGRALLKLASAGVPSDREAIDAVAPRVVADEPSFDAMWQATVQRTPVQFDYRTPRDSALHRRRLQPWAVVTHRERWYVVGHDLDREAPRMFRLGRVQGAVTVTDRPGSYQVPADLDLRELTASLAPGSGERTTATLLARPGAAIALRRLASSVEAGAATVGSDGPGWDRLTLEFDSRDGLRRMILGAGASVVVEGPESLRSEVIAALEALTTVEEVGA